MLLAQEIAERLSTDEYINLCKKIEDKFHRAFSVVDIQLNYLGKDLILVIVELENKTRHRVLL